MKTTWRNLYEYRKLIIASLLTGFLCALLADSLKKITEYYESILFNLTQAHWLLNLLFPITGLSIIYFLRQYLFHKKENKGIKEIFASLKTRHNELPAYKIPSHYLNGLLTVAFGGSTGIEVSTVVASASVGSISQSKGKIHALFRKELICAGVAAGVTALFNNPLAGILFSLEVITKKVSRHSLVSTLLAVGTAWGFNSLIGETPLFSIHTSTWHFRALPFFLLLGVLAGLNSVYLTRCVLFFKAYFARWQQHSYKLLAGAAIVSLALVFLPQLYGDGYHAMKELFTYGPGQSSSSLIFMATLLLIILLKPLVTSATLASGGDGGIFAPSLFVGAFLGLLTALVLNRFFHADVIPLNFMMAGMGAVLSASLHAPFTAILLVCGITGNYVLIIPLTLACLVSQLTAKLIFPYTVYSYPVKS